MEWTQAIIQIGVSGATLYILSEYLKRTDERIDARDKAFTEFVQSNNHKVTDLVVTSTKAIQESTNAIKESTAVIKEASILISSTSRLLNDKLTKQ